MTKSIEVRDELRRIAEEHGGLLRAADVVAEAANAASPLHGHFEWDDGEAAHQYRLQQARQLIRVTVEVQQYEQHCYRVRAYVSLQEDRVEAGGGYRVTAQVLGSQTGREQLLDQALRELNNLKIRFQELTELVAVFAAIDRATRNYGDTPPPPPPPQSGQNDAPLGM